MTLQKAEEQIKQLNADLQKNLAQLEASNKELESFSYSVSHDLRAPLRAMDSYSKMLEEDYAHLFDDEAKRLLGNIQQNAVKMNNMIDDLLKFSRLGRKEISKFDINMEELVKKVIDDMNHSIKHKAEIKLNSLSPAQADSSLLTQVWTNLLSNAIKYSSKKEKAVIEIGCSQQPHELIYYVKDNGAGFNMLYADKLFGMFQRLHSQSEFEGNGIGLAIARRIIAKHGGRVWVEATENEGATFYFSLPVLP